jgi:alanyl-tRNA synthetase
VPATPLTILEAFNTSIESIEAALTEALKDMELNTDQHDVGKKQSSEHQKAEHNVVAGKANELQARIAELEKSLASAKADLETAQKDAAAKDVSVKATKPASAKAHTLSSIIAQRKAIYTQNEEGSASEGSNPVRGPPPNVSMASKTSTKFSLQKG